MITPIEVIQAEANLSNIRKKLNSAKAKLLAAQTAVAVARSRLKLDAPEAFGRAFAGDSPEKLEEAKLAWSRAEQEHADAELACSAAQKEVDDLTKFEEAAAISAQKARAVFERPGGRE